MKNTVLYFLLAVCLITGTSFLPGPGKFNEDDQSPKVINMQDTFPVPPANKKMMFYVQRTHNTNTIVYELNYNKDSTLNKTEPIRIYWIRYANGGGVEELSSLQRKYAYGVTAVCIDTVKKMYKVNFVSYKKRDIFLTRAKTGNAYMACMVIDNKLAYLHKIFVRIDGGTFWIPHITYVEATGTEVKTGKPVSERIIP